MNRDGRSSSNDPTAERTASQSTQPAGGRGAAEESAWADDQVINRGPLETPRRYEQPIEDDEDPVMPSDDSTLNTKI